MENPFSGLRGFWQNKAEVAPIPALRRSGAASRMGRGHARIPMGDKRFSQFARPLSRPLVERLSSGAVAPKHAPLGPEDQHGAIRILVSQAMGGLDQL